MRFPVDLIALCCGLMLNPSGIANSALCDDEAGWFTFQIGDNAVPRDDMVVLRRDVPLRPMRMPPRLCRVLRVGDEAENPWLRVRIVSDPDEGWVPAGDLVLLEAAVAWSSRELTNRPDDVFQLLVRAVAQIMQGDTAAAHEDLDRALEIRPDAEARLLHGSYLLGQGDFRRSAEDYSQAVQAEPESARAYLYRAIARRALGEVAGALEDLDRSLALDPRSSEAYRNRGELRAEREEFDSA
jgi:tetratricopeptide (TPR) repeat protein